MTTVQLQQPLRRFDPNPPAATSISTQISTASGIRISSPVPSTTSRLPPGPPSTRPPPEHVASDRLDDAPDELMLVVAARLERPQRVFRDPQFQSGQRLHVLDARHALEGDHRPPVLHPRRRNRQSRLAPARSRPQTLTRPESLLDEIRFRIHDDLASKPVRARDPPHEHHASHCHVSP